MPGTILSGEERWLQRQALELCLRALRAHNVTFSLISPRSLPDGEKRGPFQGRERFQMGTERIFESWRPRRSAVLGNQGPHLSPLTFRSENHL